MPKHTLEEVRDKAASYFRALDAAADRASRHKEHLTSQLPSWVLAHRRITVAYIKGFDGFTVRAVPDDSLAQDVFDTLIALNEAEFRDATKPFPLNIQRGVKGAVWFGDPRVEDQNEPLLPPVFAPRGVVGFISDDAAVDEALNEEKAAQSIADYWAQLEFGFEKGASAYLQMDLVFKRFSALISRRAWKERRIHRYINQHRVLLPPHKRCFYEHDIMANGETRRADFILEREAAFPALLIELESPLNPLFRADGELTREANHAREQIREWVEMIDDEPANRSGDMAFLRGPKQRLIVQGEGLRFADKMHASGNSDTITWSYDMLLREARERVHLEFVQIYMLTGGSADEVPQFT
jgi:antiviral defense system Shedu protein SduA